MASTKSLGTLINDTIKFTQTHLVVLVVGAVVFGFLTQGVTWWFIGSSGFMGGQTAVMWQQQMNDATEKMKALQDKAMQGGGMDAESQKQMEDLAKQITEQSMQGAGMMGSMLKSILPALGISLLLGLLVMAVAKSYFLIVAVKGMNDPATALQATLTSLLPLIGLWIWLAIRTFIWIPFVGIIVAIILGPRFLLAPLYLLEQHKGSMESARMSYAKTRGWWGKIFGNAFVFGLVVMICAAVVSKIVGSILGFMIGGFVAAMLTQFAGALLVVFSMQLARTVMDNSRA